MKAYSCSMGHHQLVRLVGGMEGASYVKEGKHPVVLVSSLGRGGGASCWMSRPRYGFVAKASETTESRERARRSIVQEGEAVKNRRDALRL